MMRAESSILGLVEIVGGKAEWRLLLPFARWLIQVAFRTSDRSWLLAASCKRHVLENAAGSLVAMACEA